MKRLLLLQIVVGLFQSCMMVNVNADPPLHGSTSVSYGVYDKDNNITQDVPLSCLSDVSQCGGKFAVTAQNPFPILDQIAISHSDGGAFCHKVGTVPSGYVNISGVPARSLYFTLGRTLCNFGPLDYRWFNNGDYLGINVDYNFGWTSTRPAIIDPSYIQGLCSNNWGKNVTKPIRLSVSLRYNDGNEDPNSTIDKTINVTFNCPPMPTYLGCFKDSTSRVLPTTLLSPTGGKMTIEQCVVAAQAKNLTYAGLQFGTQCYGGNTLSFGDIAADQSECNMPCDGNSNETCGGVWRNSVYLAKQNANPPATSLGCFKDNSDSSRMLPVQLSASSTMTIESCMAAARAQNLPFAGVQFGGQCYGGGHIDQSRSASADNCKMPCNANKNELCGGVWHSSVYVSGFMPSSCAYTDFLTDRYNCGKCGNICGFNTACQKGQCVVSCSAGNSQCGDKCVDLKSDDHNCGVCGRTCGSGSNCQNGQCQATPVQTCTSGQSKCGNSCVSLSNDSRNCGACGVVCGSGRICQNRACVSQSQTCGGQTCGAGLYCCQGACRASGVGECPFQGNSCEYYCPKDTVHCQNPNDPTSKEYSCCDIYSGRLISSPGPCR